MFGSFSVCCKWSNTQPICCIAEYFKTLWNTMEIHEKKNRQRCSGVQHSLCVGTLSCSQTRMSPPVANIPNYWQVPRTNPNSKMRHYLFELQERRLLWDVHKQHSGGNSEAQVRAAAAPAATAVGAEVVDIPPRRAWLILQATTAYCTHLPRKSLLLYAGRRNEIQ